MCTFPHNFGFNFRSSGEQSPQEVPSLPPVVLHITPPKSEATKQSKRSKQSQNADVSVRHSLRTQLIALFVLLLVGCVFMIVFATVSVNQSGAEWSRSTGVHLKAKVVANLQSIADAKATFVKVISICRINFLFCFYELLSVTGFLHAALHRHHHFGSRLSRPPPGLLSTPGMVQPH